MKIKNLPHKKNVIHIYTDGACSGNPGPGGFGVVCLNTCYSQTISDYIERYTINYTYSEQSKSTTNNREELKAILHVLKIAAEHKEYDFTIYSDSAYCINILKPGGWIETWSRNGLIKSNKKQTIENLDLIKTIYKYLNIEFFNCQVVKEKGHCGVPGNEIADALATGNKEKINKIIEKNNLSIRLKKLS